MVEQTEEYFLPDGKTVVIVHMGFFDVIIIEDEHGRKKAMYKVAHGFTKWILQVLEETNKAEDVEMACVAFGDILK